MKINMRAKMLAYCISLFFTLHVQGQKIDYTSTSLGAYYFDGWTGLTQQHITKKLKDSFSDREPIEGWITSTPRQIEEQIDQAAKAGIDFFSFCWYYPPSDDALNQPENHALKLFREAKNKRSLRFTLLIANHQGFIISPSNWSKACSLWLGYFKDSNFLKVDDKPLLTFFSVNTLIKSFGSTESVKRAFDSLRMAALNLGMNGVTIAACVDPDSSSIRLAKSTGIDVLTGYNYHGVGFSANRNENSIDSLIYKSPLIWNKFEAAGLPYIPVVTLNWDPRPWAKDENFYSKTQRYIGFSPSSIYQSILQVNQWIKHHPHSVVKEKIAMIYSWNEYGEGAWLTPTKKWNNQFLENVKKAHHVDL